MLVPHAVRRLRMEIETVRRTWICAATAAALALLAPAIPWAQTEGEQGGGELRTIQLRTGAVKMPERVPEGLVDQVGEAVERRRALSPAAPAEVPLLVVFERTLTAADRPELREVGLEVVSRLNPRAYVVLASPEGAKRLVGREDVASASLYPSANKIVAEARPAKAPESMQRSGGRRAYSVLFFPNTPAAEVEALAETGLEAELEDFSAQAFPVVRTATVVIDPDRLGQLADAPSVRVIEPASPPNIPDNANNTQPLSNVDDVQLPPYNLSGAGVNVGVWEATEGATNGFGIRDTHEDLTPRVTVEEASNFSNHATHVAGTVAASGVNTPAAEGMAPASNLASYGAAGAANEMTLAAQSAGGANDPLPIAISNHSYGFGIGWNGRGTAFGGNQNLFGNYTNASVALDNVVVATDLIAVKSAGNHRNDAGDPNVGPRDCTQGGFAVDADCIGPQGTTKNLITVGAMNGANQIAGFSSFGPTDDGRIKPDLMAQGVGVLSTEARTDSNTDTMSGTSMASPAVAGIAVLLLEDARNRGIDLSAAAMKAILIQTAQDVAGVGQSTVGPDFATGYGIADAQAAADLLRRPAGPGLAQETITAAGAGGAYTQAFAVPAGMGELRMTLAWTDPAGDPTTPQNQAKLQNDLDLRLIAPDGTQVTPWRLNPAQPGNAAVRDGGDDTVNNVEQVSVLNPAAGVWQAQVTGKATSQSFPQDFALAGPLTPATGPIESTPKDVMLVLDTSGSMNLAAASPGLSKIEALQNAASALANYLEIVGGHQLGLVRFSNSAGATSPAFDLQPLDAGSVGAALTAIDNLTAGGRTNIIDGITRATNQLAGPSAANADQSIVLFSDGKHNQPQGSDVADIDGIMADATQFFSIGYGTDVDSSVMPGVAANHDGQHLEEQSLTAAELGKLFLTVGGAAIDETVVVDPDYPIKPGDRVHQRLVAVQEDRAITFAVHWSQPQERRLFFRVRGPDRRCGIQDRDHAGYQTRSGPMYKLIRIQLPYTCPGTGQRLHAGEWTLSVSSKLRTTETLKIMALADTALTFDADARAQRRSVRITARFGSYQAERMMAARLIADVVQLRVGRGNSAKQDERGSDRGGTADRPRVVLDPGTLLQPERLDRIEAPQLRRLSERLGLPEETLKRLDPERLAEITRFRPQPRVIQPEPGFRSRILLRDDGRGGDEEPFDGVFTGIAKAPETGLYQVHVRAQMPSPDGTLTREALTSAFVK
jgi:hypothetical protein